MAVPKLTVLRGDNVTYREEFANQALTCGHLVSFAANDRLTKHATSGAPAARMFVVEIDSLGDDNTASYASGDRVRYADCAPGTIVYAHLASGQNVAKGDPLMSNGAGFLTAHTGTNVGLATADEDANASTGVAAGGSIRFRARVI